MQTCEICKETKTNSEFAKSHAREVGRALNPWCRKCGRTKNRPMKNKAPKDAPNRLCIGCNVILPATKFYYRASNGAFSSRCRQCHCVQSLDKYKEKSQYRMLQTNSYYFKHYGVTLEEVENLVARANNCCEICAVEFTSQDKPRIDHCHATGKVRGVLCYKCNIGLGMFRDSIILLEKSIKYVNKI